MPLYIACQVPIKDFPKYLIEHRLKQKVGFRSTVELTECSSSVRVMGIMYTCQTILIVLAAL